MTWYTRGEQPGYSVFLRDDDSIFHTYSTFARGVELLNPTTQFLGHSWITHTYSRVAPNMQRTARSYSADPDRAVYFIIEPQIEVRFANDAAYFTGGQ